MIGLLLASYRANSTPCKLNTCAFTAARAYTSPQPTVCSGPWVLESAWDCSHTSTAYPWLREPRPRACEHSTREDGTAVPRIAMGSNCCRVWFTIGLGLFLQIDHNLLCLHATNCVWVTHLHLLSELPPEQNNITVSHATDRHLPNSTN